MKIASVTLLVEIDDDVTIEDLARDLENELGSSVYFDRADRRLTTIDDPRSFEWRGSEASATLLEAYVNRVDAHPYRAGRAVARATAELSEVRANTIGAHPADGAVVRDLSVCTVDAYDGIHHLAPGDRLAIAADGWRVDRADR